jgi:hypothetical protein
MADLLGGIDEKLDRPPKRKAELPDFLEGKIGLDKPGFHVQGSGAIGFIAPEDKRHLFDLTDRPNGVGVSQDENGFSGPGAVPRFELDHKRVANRAGREASHFHSRLFEKRLKEREAGIHGFFIQRG